MTWSVKQAGIGWVLLLLLSHAGWSQNTPIAPIDSPYLFLQFKETTAEKNGTTITTTFIITSDKKELIYKKGYSGKIKRPNIEERVYIPPYKLQKLLALLDDPLLKKSHDGKMLPSRPGRVWTTYHCQNTRIQYSGSQRRFRSNQYTEKLSEISFYLFTIYKNRLK